MLFTLLLAILIIAAVVLLLGRKHTYSRDHDGITINGTVNKKILYSHMLEVRKIDRAELGAGLKFGLRGPGVMHGLFHFPQLGDVLMSVDDVSKMVLIRTLESQYVISPQNPDNFIRRIRERNR